MKRFIIVMMVLMPLVSTAQEMFNQEQFGFLEFRNVGPARGGRVTAVAGVESQPGVFYMGATGGGIWKTKDYGNSWTNISDGFFESPSIGAIRVFQSDPDIIYAGTGSDGIRSNVIIGKGLYKSTDAGMTWKFSGLKQAGQIGAVEIDPANADRVFVAAIGNPFGPNQERGVYRTTDGGDTWEQVLFISENTGACDLEINPSNPDIIYASMWSVRRKPWTIISGSDEGGLYRSVDGGNTWTKLTNGLPSGIVGKSDLAVCPVEPDMVYLLVEAENGQNGLYVSDNRGESFILVSDQANLLDRPFYYTNLDVDPTNGDILYVNTTGFFKSTDRGKSWTRRSTPHGDNHDMWINPSDPDIFIQSNDGGANVTRDGGITWSTQMNQPTAELYQVDLDDQFPYWLYAGQQDNTTVAIPSNLSTGMRGQEYFLMSAGGCETGPAVPKPGNPDIVYANCKGRFGRYNKKTGIEQQYAVGAANMYGQNPADLKYRFQRVSPIIVSPHDPGVVYHGSQYLHRTTDEGITWETISPDLTAFEPDKQVESGSPITRDITGEEFYSTIYSVAESPLKKGVIWTGANDGPVFVTTDNGVTWANVTPEGLPGGGRVQTVEASPNNPARAFIAVYRYLLNDWEPYIYRTDDYGKTWMRLTDGTNGIEIDNPTRVIREYPLHEGVLFAGTEQGLYISVNNGVTWDPFQFNLPLVPVTDIKIFRNDLILSTMGRSFWVMDNISLLEQLNLVNGNPGATLFNPKVTYRAVWDNHAAIDYHLGSKAENIKVTIYSPENEKVRVFTGDKSGVNADDGEDKMLMSGTTGLEIEEGYHRLIWDLRTYGASTGEGRRGGRGPLVPPGRYRIVLNSADTELVTFLEILPDPGMIADGLKFSDYREQFNLSIKVRDLAISAKELSDRVDKKWLELNEKGVDKLSRKERLLYGSLAEVRNELITAEGPYTVPVLNDQVSYLFSMVSSVDQRPGKDAYIRYDELANWYTRLKDRFNEIIY